MIDQEQKLVIPWIILPPDQGASLLTLVVSAPDGELAEFRISGAVAAKLPDMLASNALWQTFFSSLINSMELASE